MKLPIALQATLDESERLFTKTLARLGLDRRQLDSVAERIRNEQSSNKPHPAASEPTAGRRIYHV